MRFILLVFLWAITMPAFSAKYYIDAVNGSDSNTGTSSGSAWKTLSKVNSRTFLPGDSILLIRGSVWRETLVVPSSGTSTSYLGFGAYGSGPNPRILGSNQGTWSSSGANIWISDQTFTDPYGNGFTSEIFFEGTNGSVTRGVHKTATSGLAAEFDWTWATNHIYVYSTIDPDTRYKAVEIPQRGTLIEPNNKNYLGFKGIDLFYSASEGFGDGAYPNQNNSGLIIENCEIAYHGSMNAEIGYGTTAVYSDMIIRNCKIHDCGRRGISIDPYASGFTIRNILIQGNELYNGSHTTAVDMSIGSGNFTVSLDNITICNNLIYDAPDSPLTSEQIFAQNYGVGGTFTNLKIYNNIFKYPNMSSVHLEKVQSASITDNTFFSHNKVKNGNTFHVFVDAGSTNILIKNNIFYSDLTTDAGVVGIAIYESPSQDHTQIAADYNLYYRTVAGLRLVLANGANYSASNFSGLQSQIGWETHSPAPQNPLFFSSADYHLQPGSPAISRGISLPEVVTDFEGTVRSNPPEIGSLEYGGSPAPSVPVCLSSVVENAIPTRLELNYSLSLASIVPPAASFSVLINSVGRSVTAVAVSGAKVMLTLASPVQYGDNITVSYTKPSSNPVQTPTGGQAASFTGNNVVNNVQAAIPVYVRSVVENATPNILEITYNQELVNIAPAISAFSVMVNSVPRTVNSISVIGCYVQLNLANGIVYGDNIAVSYTKPATNPLQTGDGGFAANLSGQIVTNNVIEDPITRIKRTQNNISVSIYPNPAKDYFNVAFADLGEIILRYIRIINGTGVIMIQVLAENGVLELHVPITLESGIYYVQVISDSGRIVAVKKLMVKR